jgi:excisionase family DNA binding protein
MTKTQTPTEPARMLDVTAVANLLGVSSRHVYRLADGGRMPRPLKLGGAVRWDRRTIEDWIAAGCPNVATRQGIER